MKTLTNSARKILMILLLIVSFIFLTNITLIPSYFSASARSYIYSNDSSISIENGDFTSFSRGGTGAPYSISDDDWTVVGGSDVLTGVIDVSDETFDDNNGFGLSENPGRYDGIDSSSDNYILMFSSNSSSRASVTSQETTLTNAKFYEISILVKTSNEGVGSIYASIGDGVSFTNISSPSWRVYYILVATDDISSETFDISLHFGGGRAINTTGQVFYDNIEIKEISHSDFYSAEESTTLQKVDLTRPLSTSFINYNFEDSIENGWIVDAIPGTVQSIVGIYPTDTINSLISDAFPESEDDTSARTFVYGNTSSLLLLNKDSTTSSVSTNEDNLINIAQHGFYKLTVLLKTGDLSGDGVTITLTPENENIESVEQTNQTSSSGLDNYNGFTKVTFYIKGSVTKDEKVSMSISLGEGAGWAIVDDILLQPISASEYSSSSALDLSTEITDTSDIANGLFDFSDNESYTLTYPLKPQDWTYTSSTLNAKSGIIRINPEYFEKDYSNYGYPINPGVNTAFYEGVSIPSNYFNENVLMVRNTSSEDAYFTSDIENTSLTQNTNSNQAIVRISVGVNTQNSASAFIRLVDEDGNVIAIFDNINTNNEWQMFYFYINNGITEKNIAVELGVHGRSANDYAFFDTVSFEEDVSEQVTFSDMTSKNSAYINFMQNGFDYSTNFSDYESASESYNYGITTSVPSHNDAQGNSVLQITNTIEDDYQTIISDYTYSLTEGSYYEISVWIRTNFDNNALIFNGENYGAYFELVNIDEDGNIVIDKNNENPNKFENIIVTATNENNGWIKYSMYILAESDQNVKILLGLGTEENPTMGTAYFDDMTVTDITEETYAAQKENETTIVSNVIEISQEDSSDESTSPSTEAPVNVWILASSILLVVALILAIAGYLIRKIPKNKIKKVDSSEYDKAPTDIDENAIKKELKERREENLSKLKSELETLQKEYDALKSEYEKQTENDEIVNKELYAEFTKKANKLIDRIDYLNSAVVYLEDEANIKMAERKEISKKKQEAKEKFKQLNQIESEENKNQD